MILPCWWGDTGGHLLVRGQQHYSNEGTVSSIAYLSLVITVLKLAQSRKSSSLQLSLYWCWWGEVPITMFSQRYAQIFSLEVSFVPLALKKFCICISFPRYVVVDVIRDEHTEIIERYLQYWQFFLYYEFLRFFLWNSNKVKNLYN